MIILLIKIEHQKKMKHKKIKSINNSEYNSIYNLNYFDLIENSN